jgi:hypothetical protein
VSEAAARQLGVEGFVALWRGERVTVTDLCDDPMVIDAQVRSGRLEVDDAGVVVGVHGLTARPTRHRIECGRAQGNSDIIGGGGGGQRLGYQLAPGRTDPDHPALS